MCPREVRVARQPAEKGGHTAATERRRGKESSLLAGLMSFPPTSPQPSFSPPPSLTPLPPSLSPLSYEEVYRGCLSNDGS